MHALKRNRIICFLLIPFARLFNVLGACGFGNKTGICSGEKNIFDWKQLEYRSMAGCLNTFYCVGAQHHYMQH